MILNMKTAKTQVEPENNPIIWDSRSLELALGVNVPQGLNIYSVSIDSREIKKDALFVSLKGENFDGNDFAISALENGAAVALVDREIKVSKTLANRLIKVEDCFKALYKLAEFSRNRMKGKVIGVTGSVGKTTTKEMLRLCLSKQGEVYASVGNFNNHFGLPLTLANMPESTEYAVLEMGMSGKGEIHNLSILGKPDVSIITTVEAVHLEFFSSVAGIAEAKSEIFDGMKKGGVAILNFDNSYHKISLDKAKKEGLNVVGFAKKSPANFKLDSYKNNGITSSVSAEIFGKPFKYEIGISGEHHALNSLAVLAAIHAAGGEIESAAYQLKNFHAQKGRGYVHSLKDGVVVIDDSYNASPSSISAALCNMTNFRNATPKRLIAVLGDMKELGVDAEEFHKGLAKDIIANKIDCVYTVGKLMFNLYKSLPANLKGMHTDNSNEMADILAEKAKKDDVILVKGSNSMKMSVIVDRLVSGNEA